MITEGSFLSILHKNIHCGYALESKLSLNYHQIPSSVPLVYLIVPFSLPFHFEMAWHDFSVVNWATNLKSLKLKGK